MKMQKKATPKNPELRFQDKTESRGCLYAYANFGAERRYYGRVKTLNDRGALKGIRAQFDADLSLWLGNGRRFPEEADSLTIKELVDRYRTYKNRRHGPNWFAKGGTRTHYAVAILEELYSLDWADEFSPVKLEALRKTLISRGRCCRGEINARVREITALFKWANSQGVVEESLPRSLSNLPSLRPGEEGVREGSARQDVPWEKVEPVLAYLPPPLAAVVLLMWHTGARPSEILNLAPAMIDRSDDDLWTAILPEHKSAHKGKVRAIPLGKQSQGILKPFLVTPFDQPHLRQIRPANMLFFSPREAVEALNRKRRQDRKTPLWASHEARYARQREEKPDRVLRDFYSSQSLSQAVARAIGAYNKAREVEGLEKIELWSPYRIRHSYATRVARACGAEAAQLLLGHASVKTTMGYTHDLLGRVKDVYRENKKTIG